MAQNFPTVTLNTEISQGLDELQQRDLTAATKSDSQRTFPVSPFDGQIFCHSGEKQIYAYVDNQWKKLWNYEHGAPYTIEELNSYFQASSENLTNFSSIAAAEKIVFAFPQMAYTITPSWLFAYGKCGSKKDLGTFLKIGDVGYLNTANAATLDDGTIPPTAFEKNLETEVPREMETGCVKRTFATTWDKTKWVPATGKTIGASVSNADFRGDIYKKLFLHFGGTEGQWESGGIVTLPNFQANDFLICNTEYKTETKEMSLGYAAELRQTAGQLNFETQTAVNDGDVRFELIAAGSAGTWMQWKRKGKSQAYVASGGGGEYASGLLHLSAGDRIRVQVGSVGSVGGDSTISINEKEVVRVKGAPSHGVNESGPGGTGGTFDEEKVTAAFVRGHYGQFYHDVGLHHPLTMFGGASGDPNGTCTDNPTGKHYAGNNKYVSYNSGDRVGSGASCSVFGSANPPHGGYVRIDDDDGVLHGAENQPVIYCNFLIRL